MAYISHNSQFRSLDDDEEKEFRDYAINNDPPSMSGWDYYHPVCRSEWVKRGIKPE